MIQLKNVFKHFKINGEDSIVLKDINLRIEKKDVFGLVGKTGSGKSTILRLMNGFMKPDQGEVFLMNEELDHSNRKTLIKKTSMIFQNFNLLNNLTVLENVLLPIKLRKKDKETYLLKADELLEFVGLSDFKNAFIKTLSNGQKQRVAIARALITDPDVIFCDEPTSALDEKVAYEILKLLSEINQRLETTIVLISHDINVIKALCTKVAILEEGSIISILDRTPVDMKPLSYLEALSDV